MKRDAAEWWTQPRIDAVAKSQLARDYGVTLHCSACARTITASKDCTCVPVTLRFGSDVLALA